MFIPPSKRKKWCYNISEGAKFKKVLVKDKVSAPKLFEAVSKRYPHVMPAEEALKLKYGEYEGLDTLEFVSIVDPTLGHVHIEGSISNLRDNFPGNMNVCFILMGAGNGEKELVAFH